MLLVQLQLQLYKPWQSTVKGWVRGRVRGRGKGKGYVNGVACGMWHREKRRVSVVDTRRKKLLVSYLSYLISCKCNKICVCVCVWQVHTAAACPKKTTTIATCNSYEVIFAKNFQLQVVSCKQLQRLWAESTMLLHTSHVPHPHPPSPPPSNVCLCVCVCCQQIFVVILLY